jgi:hypothetical protein
MGRLAAADAELLSGSRKATVRERRGLPVVELTTEITENTEKKSCRGFARIHADLKTGFF